MRFLSSGSENGRYLERNQEMVQYSSLIFNKTTVSIVNVSKDLLLKDTNALEFWPGRYPDLQEMHEFQSSGVRNHD